MIRGCPGVDWSIGMYCLMINTNQYYGSVIVLCDHLGICDDPACVVITASVDGYQSVLLKLDQCIEILIKPGVLHWNPWYITRCVLVLLLVCQEVLIQIPLRDP